MSNIYPKLRNVNSNSNWQTATLGDVVKEYKVSNKLIHHQNLLSLSYGKIVPKDIESKKGLLPASFDTYQIIKENIIVFRVTDLQNDKKSLRVGIALFKYENGIQDLENLPEIEIMKFDEKYDVDDQSNLGCFSSFWNSSDLITVIDEDFEFKVKESGTYVISVVIHAGGEDIECTGVAAFQFPITISE